MTDLIWHTEVRKIGDLIPMASNPRRLSTKAKEDLTASISKFNLMSIPVVNIDNTIISGHQRMKIMVLLGRAEESIDVRVPNRALTPEEMKEACVRENRNVGEWDWDKLTAEFPTADLLQWGFDDAEFGKVNATPLRLPSRGEGDWGEGERSGIGAVETEKPAEGEQTPETVAEAQKKPTPAKEGVRLVQIYFNEADYGLFIIALDKVQKHLGLDNISDAIFLTLKEASLKVGNDDGQQKA